ncbi:Paired domain-containing protein [Meloidogyne graminicola]|uniref:Paired domain-containing protein n=1 Tax=Meloidogyne graminicola TaxID=189291 RepID=A0A8S9ZPN9_9BILA|nr:Paired domain-containing protein [Meloidogyne graminicola]
MNGHTEFLKMNKIKVEEIDWHPLISNNQQKFEQNKKQNNCRCLIDISSPEALKRDFYAWLNGIELDNDISRPCLFATSNNYLSSSSTTISIIEEIPAFFAPLDYPVSVSSFCYSSSSSAASSSSISPGNSTNFCNNSIVSCSNQIGIFNQILANNHYQEQQSTTISKRIRSNQKNNYNNKEECVGGSIKVRRKRNVDKASGRGTNLYGRSYCPGRPLSMEERAKIIQLFHGGMKVNAISKQLCISHGCVSKIITRFRETGNLMPSSHAECRRRKRQQLQLK